MRPLIFALRRHRRDTMLTLLMPGPRAFCAASGHGRWLKVAIKSALDAQPHESVELFRLTTAAIMTFS
jgi:hypothetical protein